MSRRDALKERKSRREGRANWQFALTLSMRPFGKTRQTASLPYHFRRKNGEETNNARRAGRIRLVGRRAQEGNEETERRENRARPGFVRHRTRGGGDRGAEKVGETDRRPRRLQRSAQDAGSA